MERTAHVICVPLYFFRALTLVLEYAAAEKLYIEFHPTIYVNMANFLHFYYVISKILHIQYLKST